MPHRRRERRAHRALAQHRAEAAARDEDGHHESVRRRVRSWLRRRTSPWMLLVLLVLALTATGVVVFINRDTVDLGLDDNGSALVVPVDREAVVILPAGVWELATPAGDGPVQLVDGPARGCRARPAGVCMTVFHFRTTHAGVGDVSLRCLFDCPTRAGDELATTTWSVHLTVV